MAGLKYDRYSEIYRKWEEAAIAFWQDLRTARSHQNSAYSLQKIPAEFERQQQIFWEDLANQRNRF